MKKFTKKSFDLIKTFFIHSRKYGMFAAKGIFEPPKYFPFGTGHNWEVKITCKTYFNEIAV